MSGTIGEWLGLIMGNLYASAFIQYIWLSGIAAAYYEPTTCEYTPITNTYVPQPTIYPLLSTNTTYWQYLYGNLIYLIKNSLVYILQYTESITRYWSGTPKPYLELKDNYTQEPIYAITAREAPTKLGTPLSLLGEYIGIMTWTKIKKLLLPDTPASWTIAPTIIKPEYYWIPKLHAGRATVYFSPINTMMILVPSIRPLFKLTHNQFLFAIGFITGISLVLSPNQRASTPWLEQYANGVTADARMLTKNPTNIIFGWGRKVVNYITSPCAKATPAMPKTIKKIASKLNLSPIIYNIMRFIQPVQATIWKDTLQLMNDVMELYSTLTGENYPIWLTTNTVTPYIYAKLDPKIRWFLYSGQRTIIPEYHLVTAPSKKFPGSPTTIARSTPAPFISLQLVVPKSTIAATKIDPIPKTPTDVTRTFENYYSTVYALTTWIMDLLKPETVKNLKQFYEGTLVKNQEWIDHYYESLEKDLEDSEYAFDINFFQMIVGEHALTTATHTITKLLKKPTPNITIGEIKKYIIPASIALIIGTSSGLIYTITCPQCTEPIWITRSPTGLPLKPINIIDAALAWPREKLTKYYEKTLEHVSQYLNYIKYLLG